MKELLDAEAKDGVRMPWNIIPGTKSDASACIVPVSVVYTPIKPIPAGTLLPYRALRCRACRSVLKPFCTVDFSAKFWICPFSFTRNPFPSNYSSISEQNLPVELLPHCTTVEYEEEQSRRKPPSPVFLFVVDTCLIGEEIGFLKSGLSLAIELLPENSLVGFITFGSFVYVHELGSGRIAKTYVFKGDTDHVNKDQLLEQMGSIERFLSPASECKSAMNSVCLGILDIEFY